MGGIDMDNDTVLTPADILKMSQQELEQRINREIDYNPSLELNSQENPVTNTTHQSKECSPSTK